MAKFIPYDYNQSTMVVINFNDQIQYSHSTQRSESIQAGTKSMLSSVDYLILSPKCVL